MFSESQVTLIVVDRQDAPHLSIIRGLYGGHHMTLRLISKRLAQGETTWSGSLEIDNELVWQSDGGDGACTREDLLREFQKRMAQWLERRGLRKGFS